MPLSTHSGCSRCISGSERQSCTTSPRGLRSSSQAPEDALGESLGPRSAAPQAQQAARRQGHSGGPKQTALAETPRSSRGLRQGHGRCRVATSPRAACSWPRGSRKTTESPARLAERLWFGATDRTSLKHPEVLHAKGARREQ